VVIEVDVERLLGGFQHQMAIRTTLEVTGNHGSDTWREAPLQVFANQTDSLSARHGGPQKRTPLNTEHEVLQLAE